MLEASVLVGKQQNEFTRLNALLNGDVPNWEWFKETNDPVGNYRTYLLAKLYNRYAILFTDDHHKEMAEEGKETKVIKVQSNYDVLGQDFYGSIRWNHFEKLRKFLEESNIDPAIWLSAQFNRAIFNVASGKTSKTLPFPNALYGDTAYAYYKEYREYHKKGQLWAWYKEIPSQFANDYAIQAIREGYASAKKANGLLQYKGSIKSFLEGSPNEKEQALITFYRITEQNLHNKGVSYKTRDTIKKYMLMQSLIATKGIVALPNYLILGSEFTQAMLARINRQGNPQEVTDYLSASALGRLVLPNNTSEEQLEKGAAYLYQVKVLDETSAVLKLIWERKGLQLSIADVNKAFNEYGGDKIPVDDFSMIDTEQIVKFTKDSGLLKWEKTLEVEVIKDTEPKETKPWDFFEAKSTYPTKPAIDLDICL
jgi:hypothetical protein